MKISILLLILIMLQSCNKGQNFVGIWNEIGVDKYQLDTIRITNFGENFKIEGKHLDISVGICNKKDVLNFSSYKAYYDPKTDKIIINQTEFTRGSNWPMNFSYGPEVESNIIRY
jgi:hypothetical protein